MNKGPGHGAEPLVQPQGQEVVGAGGGLTPQIIAREADVRPAELGDVGQEVVWRGMCGGSTADVRQEGQSRLIRDKRRNLYTGIFGIGLIAVGYGMTGLLSESLSAGLIASGAFISVVAIVVWMRLSCTRRKLLAPDGPMAERRLPDPDPGGPPREVTLLGDRQQTEDVAKFHHHLQKQ
jgi:hypothetical protein